MACKKKTCSRLILSFFLPTTTLHHKITCAAALFARTTEYIYGKRKGTFILSSSADRKCWQYTNIPRYRIILRLLVAAELIYTYIRLCKYTVWGGTHHLSRTLNGVRWNTIIPHAIVVRTNADSLWKACNIVHNCYIISMVTTFRPTTQYVTFQPTIKRSYSVRECAAERGIFVVWTTNVQSWLFV